MNAITDTMPMPGPCVVCGLRDYPLSMGGPTICPACDCGHSGPNLVAAQKRRIEELETTAAVRAILREAFAFGVDIRHKKGCDWARRASNFQKNKPCSCGRDALYSKLNAAAFGR